MFSVSDAHKTIYERCLAYDGRDALQCALRLMSAGAVRFHGPEHHYLTAASLCSAWCNALGEEKGAHLEHLEQRCAKIPPAVCGYYGVCGDSMAAGACASEMLGAAYLSGVSWQQVNALTACTQSAIAASCKSGPRCCKRTTFAVISAASRWLRDELGVDVVCRDAPKCPFSAENPQCLRDGCAFYAGRAATEEE